MIADERAEGGGPGRTRGVNDQRAALRIEGLHPHRRSLAEAPHVSAIVSGELVGLLDQVAQVVARNAVEHPAAVPVGLDEPGQAESTQVLRHRGPGRRHLRGERRDVLRARGEQSQQVQPGGVGQVPQNLGSHGELVVVGGHSQHTCICHIVVRAHVCMMVLAEAPWQL